MGAERVCVGAQLGPAPERSQERLPPLGAWEGEEDAETGSGSCSLRWDAEAQGRKVVADSSVVRKETWTPDFMRALLSLCPKQCLSYCSVAGVTWR